MRFSSINTLQELEWITLMFEIDQIFIIPIDPNICIWSPGSLDFLCGQLVLGLELDLLLSLQVASPCPLNLNGCNMIHRKSMILEEPSCERHLVCCLDYSGAEISQALIFILMHNIERWSQELLSQLLRGSEMSSMFTNWLITKTWQPTAHPYTVNILWLRTLCTHSCILMLL